MSDYRVCTYETKKGFYCFSSETAEGLTAFTQLLDEDALYASVQDFLQENSKRSSNHWEFEENTLSFINNSGGSRKHILLPRDAMIGSGTGFELDVPGESDTPNEQGTGMKIDIGATTIGAGLIILAATVITVFIVIACREDIRNLIKKPSLPIQY